MRESGVLLHITSLPEKGGIGTLGRQAYGFVDFIAECGMNIWQVLPVGPTSYGDSPYQSFSTFAGNPLLIDLQLLVEKNWAKDDVLILPDYIKTNFAKSDIKNSIVSKSTDFFNVLNTFCLLFTTWNIIDAIPNAIQITPIIGEQLIPSCNAFPNVQSQPFLS